MDNPWMQKIEPSQGSDEAMIFMTGYCTENNVAPHHHKPWVDSLRGAGWKGAIYYLWWDSSNKDNFNSTLLQAGIGVKFHWDKHKRRAEIVGKHYVGRLVHHNVEEKTVSLIAHSLGARILYFAGGGWIPEASHKLNDIILLGGAVPKDRNWDKVVSRLNGRLFNIYNPRDSVLINRYRYTSLGVNPCGLREIASYSPRVRNINVNKYIGTSHCEEQYLETLPRLTTQGILSL